MASYTSHYNLKKPAMGETIDITDINGNMDTLDSELYSVSQEVAKSGATYVSCSSISALQSHLLTKYTDMEERESVLVAIKTTFTNTYFDVNSYWEGHMYCLDKTGNGYFTATLTNYSSANQVVISYANGTWSYNSIHNVKNLISAEATARANAISAEQSARASAISSAVSAEQTAREEADASINQALSCLRTAIGSVSGSTVDVFIQNAVNALNSIFPFGNLAIATTITGSVTWSDHDYYRFIATKSSSRHLEIDFASNTDHLTARANVSDATIVKYNQFAMKSQLGDIVMLSKLKTSSPGDLTFTTNGRGAGFLIVTQNGLQSSIYEIHTTNNNGELQFTKISGRDVSITANDNVLTVSVSNWSNAYVIYGGLIS